MKLVRTLAPALFAAIASLPVAVKAADPPIPLDGLAAEVARLRSEIEVLDARVQEQQDGRRTQLRSLATQRSTLEAELQREEMRSKQHADRIARQDERAAVEAERQKHLSRAVLAAIENLKRTLDGAIPFQIPERTAELDATARELEASTLAPGAALARLWAWVDAEVKLSRESGIHQQVLMLEGREVLADVARLGMVALYFRAPGDRVGAARPQDGVWIWETVERPEDQERIRALFTALEQDVRSGFFELPLALKGSQP